MFVLLRKRPTTVEESMTVAEIIIKPKHELDLTGYSFLRMMPSNPERVEEWVPTETLELWKKVVSI